MTHMLIHTYIHTYMHMYIYIYTIYIYIHHILTIWILLCSRLISWKCAHEFFFLHINWHCGYMSMSIMCLCIHMHVDPYVYLCICILIYIYIYIYLYWCMCKLIHMCMDTYVYIDPYTFDKYVYWSICVTMHTCMAMHLQNHAHKTMHTYTAQYMLHRHYTCWWTFDHTVWGVKNFLVSVSIYPHVVVIFQDNLRPFMHWLICFHGAIKRMIVSAYRDAQQPCVSYIP